MTIRRRRLSALSWLVVALVLVRAASGGGGGLGGIRYFADREPPLSYAAGAIVLGCSLALVVAFFRAKSRALPLVSALLALPTLVYAAVRLPDHESAIGLAAGAASAFIVAAPAAWREVARRRGRSARSRDTDHLEPPSVTG